MASTDEGKDPKKDDEKSPSLPMLDGSMMHAKGSPHHATVSPIEESEVRSLPASADAVDIDVTPEKREQDAKREEKTPAEGTPAPTISQEGAAIVAETAAAPAFKSDLAMSDAERAKHIEADAKDYNTNHDAKILLGGKVEVVISDARALANKNAPTEAIDRNLERLDLAEREADAIKRSLAVQRKRLLLVKKRGAAWTALQKMKKQRQDATSSREAAVERLESAKRAIEKIDTFLPRADVRIEELQKEFDAATKLMEEPEEVEKT